MKTSPTVSFRICSSLFRRMDSFIKNSAFGRKGVAIIVVAVFFFMLLPGDSIPESITAPTSGDFPYEDLLEAHKREELYRNNPDVLSDVEPFMDDWIASGASIPDPYAGISFSDLERLGPVQPSIIDAVLDFDPHQDFNNVFDLLSNRPLSYYVYVPYQGNERDWREGSLRPTAGGLIDIAFGDGDFGTNWVPIDVDNADGDNNDNTGTDLYVRLNPNLKSKGILSQLASGGINFEIINVGWNRSLEIYAIKAMNYTSTSPTNPTGRDVKRALVALRLSFDVVPSYSLLKVEALELMLDADFSRIISRETGEIAEITGPVHVSWSFSEDIPDFGLEAVFLSEDTAEDSSTRTWFDLFVTPGSGESSVPSNALLNASTTNPKKGFNLIRWNSPMLCNLTLSFVEERTNVTYALIDIVDMPTTLSMDISEEVTEIGNITIMGYSASSRIPYLSYRGYQYWSSTLEELSSDTPMRYTMMEVWDMPLSMHLEGTFEYGEEIETPAPEPGLNLIGSLVDNIMLRVMSRFARVSRTISSVPDKIMEAAGTGGYFVLDSSHDMEVAFLLTDGPVPEMSDPEANYFVFMNSTENDSNLDLIVGGRLKGLKNMAGNIGNETEAELNILGRRTLWGYYIDESRDFIGKLELTNIPENISVSLTGELMSYRASGGNNSFLYTSRIGRLAMLVEAVNIPPEFIMDRGEEHIAMTTSGGSIGQVSVMLTNSTPERLMGNHIYVRRTPSRASMSLSMSGVRGLSYNRSSGAFSIETETPEPLRMMMYSNVEESSFIKMLVDPLPTVFSADIPQSLATSELEFPDLSIGGGIMSIPNLLFAISDMGNAILGTFDSVLHDTVTGLGEMGTAMSFSYRSTETTDITAMILYGDIEEDAVSWTHGISAVQNQHEDGVSFAAKMYMPGLPRQVDMTIDTRPPKAFFELNLKDYAPRYNWLMFDVAGVQGREALISISEIPSPVDIYLLVDMELEMEKGGGRARGNIVASVMQMNVPAMMGTLHIAGVQDYPTKTRMEVLIPEVPSHIDLSLEMEKSVFVDYSASRQLKYVLVSAARPVGNRVAGATILLRDLPRRVVLSMSPQTDLDIDGSMLQTLPELTFTASSSTLDIFVNADGEFMGQRGRYQIAVLNMANHLSTSHDRGGYLIQGGGTDFLEIVVSDIPYSKQVYVKEMVIRAERLHTLRLHIEPVFGFYPIIELTNTGTKGVEFLVRINVLDSWDANAAFVLLTFRDGTLGNVPGHPDFIVNGGPIAMDDSPRTMIMADPGLALMATILYRGWL